MFRSCWFPEWNRSCRPVKRASRAAAKPRRRSFIRIEEFEQRVTPSCTVGVTSRVLTVDCDSSINTVNYDDNGVNTNVNGVIIADSTFDSFQINIGTGGGTVNLFEALHSGGISEVGFGNVTVNVSPTVHNLDSIAPLNIAGGSGVDALVVNDQANSNPHTYAMTATSVSRGNPINFGTQMRLLTLNGGSAANTYNVSGTGGLNLATLNTGGGSDIINVENTSNPLSVNEQGFGNDTVNVSASAQNLDDIHAGITITGNSGTDTLNINDQNNATARAYTMTATSMHRNGAAAIDFGNLMNFVNVNGGSGANTYDVSGTGGLNLTTLRTGGGNDAINIEITTRPLSVVEQGSGNDTVTVSPSAQNLNNIQGAINIGGNASSDAVVVDDQDETQTGRLFTITATSISRSQSATINFGTGMNFVTLNGGAGVGFGGNGYDVLNTPGRVSTLVQTGAGSSGVNIVATTHPLTVNFLGGSQVLDEVNVGPPGDNLNPIQANVTLNNFTASSVRLFVLDQGNHSSGLTYTLTSNSVTRTGVALISYGVRFNVEVDAATETGGNTYNVTGTPQPGFTTLNLNNGSSSGHDVVNVQATSGFLRVNGPAFGETVNVGNSAGVRAIHGDLFLQAAGNLTVNDSPDTSPRTVTMAVSGSGLATITGLAPATITYDQLDINHVTVDGGRGGNTFNIQGTVTNGLLPITSVNSGSGNDTINVGDTSNTINEILGTLSVNGQAGFDTLNINDQGSTVAHHYSITNTQVVRTRSGEPTITINYADIEALNLHPGAHFGPGPDTNVIDVLSSDTGTAVEVDVGSSAIVNAGNDTDGLDELQGPLTVAGDGSIALNINDQMTAAGQEYDLQQNELDRSNAAPIAFTNVQAEVLNAGSKSNVFDVDGIAQGTPATLNAGTGGDLVRMRQHNLIQDALTLNGQGNTAIGYVAYSTDVFVDLQLGLATDIAGFSGLSRITGGGGNNILVGDGNQDIIGGSGRNLIISGGTGQITGGGQGDIIIGGVTAYDQDFQLLHAILAYWTGSGDDYTTRVGNLRAGNGVPQLEAQITLFDGGAANTLTGHGNEALGTLNLFYVTEAGTVTDQQPSEVVVDIDGGFAPRGGRSNPHSFQIAPSAPPCKESLPPPLHVPTVDRLFATGGAAEPVLAISRVRHDPRDLRDDGLRSWNENDGIWRMKLPWDSF